MSQKLLRGAWRIVAIVAAAAVLLPGAASAWFTLSGNDIEYTCQEANAGKKVLIVYDTKYGATRTLAYRIKDVLCSEGAQVDLSTVRKIKDLSSYDAVILGSAIIVEQWRPDMLKFMKAQENVLKDKKVAVFVTCGIMREDNEENRGMAQKYYIDGVLKKYPNITLVGNAGLFGGVLDFSVLTFQDFIMIKAFNMMGEGDYRNFDNVGQWAKDFYDAIK